MIPAPCMALDDDSSLPRSSAKAPCGHLMSSISSGRVVSVLACQLRDKGSNQRQGRNLCIDSAPNALYSKLGYDEYTAHSQSVGR